VGRCGKAKPALTHFAERFDWFERPKLQDWFHLSWQDKHRHLLALD